MTGIEIDLTEPFESFLATVLSLPTHAINGNGSSNDEEIRQATRCLYEAAHGRVVETPMGAIPIAPAVAAYLKTEPLAVNTRGEFLRLAETKGGFRTGGAIRGRSGISTPSKNMNATNIASDTRNSFSHFSFDSALLEFMGGKLGAPGCWPDETHPGGGRHAELRALNRWENEGGRTLPSLAHRDTRLNSN